MFSYLQRKTNPEPGRIGIKSGHVAPGPVKNPEQIPLWSSRLPLQTALRVNEPGDRHEQEADHAAEQVMRAGAQSKTCACGKPMGADGMCEDCRRAVQRQTTGEVAQQSAPSSVSQALTQPGQRLDAPVRSLMEDRFGHDFSGVRVHADEQAARSAEDINAHAYTVGQDIVFAAGRYQPQSAAGRKLLAHELAHTIQQESLSFGPGLIQREDGSEPEKRCGPNVTTWLVDQMNTNQNHPTIVTGRENRWPRWVPGFNIGWTGAALYDFAELVGPGKPWDFKRTQGWWRAGEGRACPTEDCDRTVTLCGHCMNYDVPGNIHYGWVGRRMEIAAWMLRNAPSVVQEGAGTDPAHDTAAVDIGIAMADEGATLCDEVRSRLAQLNRDRTEGCEACS